MAGRGQSRRMLHKIKDGIIQGQVNTGQVNTNISWLEMPIYTATKMHGFIYIIRKLNKPNDTWGEGDEDIVQSN